MDLLTALQRLWARKFAVLLAILIAAAAALLTRYSVTSTGLVAKRTSASTSTLQVLVDTRVSSLARATLPTTDATVTQRTPLYADLAASLPVRRQIAVRAGVPVSSIDITSSTTETASAAGPSVSVSYNAAPAPHAANRVNLAASDLLPILSISATADTARRAAALVNATVSTLQDNVTGMERSERIRGPNRMILRALGSAKGTTVVSTTSPAKTGIVGVGVLLVLLLLILALDGVRRQRRRRGRPGHGRQRRGSRVVTKSSDFSIT